MKIYKTLFLFALATGILAFMLEVLSTPANATATRLGQNAREILGVSKCAKKDQIKKAYISLAKKYHPDRVENQNDTKWANDKMSQVNKAYETLTKKEEKKESAENNPNSYSYHYEKTVTGNYEYSYGGSRSQRTTGTHKVFFGPFFFVHLSNVDGIRLPTFDLSPFYSKTFEMIQNIRSEVDGFMVKSKAGLVNFAWPIINLPYKENTFEMIWLFMVDCKDTVVHFGSEMIDGLVSFFKDWNPISGSSWWYNKNGTEERPRSCYTGSSCVEEWTEVNGKKTHRKECTYY